jgi:hypothetical protein
MLMKWVDAAAQKVVTLAGKQNTEAGEYISTVVSVVIFGIIAWLTISIAAFVTGISTPVLWFIAIIASLCYAGWTRINTK